MPFEYSCFYSQLKQRRTVTHKCRIMTALQQEHAESQKLTGLQEKFQKGGRNAILLLPEFPDLLHLVLYSAFEL